MSSATRQVHAGLPVSARERELRQTAEREAVEVLAHQIAVERRRRVRVETSHLMVTAVLLGVTFGGSYALVRQLRVSDIKKKMMLSKRGRRRRS